MAGAQATAPPLPHTLTVSSSFSMPVGICGTVLLIALNSAKSEISSCIYTGIGFEASSCLARNLLILAAQILASPHHYTTLHNSLHGGLSGHQPTAKRGPHHLGCAHFAYFPALTHTKEILGKKHRFRRLGTAVQSWRFFTPRSARHRRYRHHAATHTTNAYTPTPYSDSLSLTNTLIHFISHHNT